MISLSKFVAGIALAASCIYLCSCTMPVRTGYDRKIGGYKPVPASETASSQEQAAPANDAAAGQAQAASAPDSGKYENSAVKARNAARHTGLPALADDSGIAVDCLNGQPGVYSSRYSGEHATDAENLDKLLREVSRFPENERTARYWCVLAFMRSAEDPTPIICQAFWKGRIITDKRGQNGFGYDPSFLIPVLGKTAAELDPDVKNRLSHRGQALTKLRDAMRDIYGEE